jgi:hypothetical protein
VGERIERLKTAVEGVCGCTATHAESHLVTETFRGEIVWEGVVESFDLDGHPKASRCYAFHLIDQDESESRTVTVLELPPIDSPKAAVKIAIASRSK